MATTQKTRPVHEVRMGRIKAAIWANETQAGVRHNVTLSRVYKDGDQWKSSDSFGRDDLLLAARVLAAASDWIYELASQDGNGQS